MLALRRCGYAVMQGLKVGALELFWLRGGTFELDGGTMFGVVPKVLWEKRYPSDEDNYLVLVNNPILVKAAGRLVLIDTGLGNKLNEKQRKIFRVLDDWLVPHDLEALGLSRMDVTDVVLTHCDFDHAGGVVMLNDRGQRELTFPRARHYVQSAEWEDVTNPNRRAAHSYWPVNFENLAESGRLVLLDGDYVLADGIRLERTDGHTRGHQVVWMESGGESAVHMADLLPTHAHINPLWIMAYDNFPLEAIERKERLENRGISAGAWFTFYHDVFMAACKLDEKGNVTEKWAPDEHAKEAV